MGYLTKLNIPNCCGFGSQMGQYAGLYSIAKSSKLDFILVKEYLTGTLFDGAYNYCLDVPFKNVPKVYSVNELSDKTFIPIGTKNIGSDNMVDHNLFNLDPNYNYILDDDVAFYKYFDHDQEEIKNLFTFKDEIVSFCKNYLEKNNKNNDIIVSISFRRGDYLNLSSLNLSLDYFNKAVEKIEELLPNQKIKYFVFSGAAFGDSGMNWVKENFKIHNQFYVEGLDKFQQLCLTSMCNHNIISNSSFAWWAAYLNKNKDKKVICPYNYVNDSRSNYLNGNYFPNDWIPIKEI